MMALSDKDIEAIAVLVEHKLESRFASIETEMAKNHSEVLGTLEQFAERDERREQEYLAMNEQLGRLEKRVDKLEEQVPSSALPS